MRRKFILGSACIALSFLNFSCESGPTIEMDGSSTVSPISEAIAEEFAEIDTEIGVNIGISGTGGGFKKFAKGDIDIANASRPIKEKEIAAAKANGISYIELEVAYDGLAVVVNKENTFAATLTTAELKKIWEPAAEGKIMKWSQVRAGFPDEELKLYGPGTDSGTYDYFTEAIVAPAKGTAKSRADFNANEDDNILVEGVAGDKYSLGFFGLAYYQENKEKLNLVAIDNGTRTVKPSLETVKDGSYSPLSRPLFIYVNNTAAKKPEVIKFINFYLDQAAKMAIEVGYIPLPDEKYTEQKAKFTKFAESSKQ